MTPGLIKQLQLELIWMGRKCWLVIVIQLNFSSDRGKCTKHTDAKAIMDIPRLKSMGINLLSNETESGLKQGSQLLFLIGDEFARIYGLKKRSIKYAAKT